MERPGPTCIHETDTSGRRSGNEPQSGDLAEADGREKQASPPGAADGQTRGHAKHTDARPQGVAVTLSIVAVQSVPSRWLVTHRPSCTAVAMVMAVVVPTWVQVLPLAE